MDRSTFLSELRRMASNNGIWLSKEDQIVGLTLGNGADFINVFGGSEKNHLLVVTSREVFHLKTGLTGAKVVWQVPVGDIQDVNAERRTFSGYVVDVLVVAAAGRTYEFQFGFNSPAYATQTAREIASKNAHTAAAEVRNALGRGNVTAPGAGPDDGQMTRLYTFINAVRPLAASEMIGRPFGEGFGLEDVVAVANKYLLGGEDVRGCDQMVAIDLLMGAGNSFHPDEVLAIMGATDEARDQFQIVPDRFKAISGLSGAATSFLGQIDTPGANMWELWSRRDDVAVEFLAWHTVARLRLATLGKLEPVAMLPHI